MASEFDDNEEIFRNVSELKRRLYQTEVSLQKLQAPRHPSLTESDSHELLPFLSLRDLDDHAHPSERRSVSDQSVRKNSSSKYRESRSWSKLYSQTKTSEERDQKFLMEKLHQLREENSLLVNENNRLQNEVESCNTDDRASQMQILQQIDNMDLLKKQVKMLKSDLKSKDKDLRSVERELERSLSQQQQWEDFINESRREADSIRDDLRSEAEVRQRAEREKAEAKQMLDSNKQEMMDYKSKVAKELKEHEHAKQYLETSLQHCDREREVLLEKATSLEEELQNAREEVRSLKINLNSLSGVQSVSKELEDVISGQEKQLEQLRNRLDEAKRENVELQETNQQQRQQLIDVRKDIEKSEDNFGKLREEQRKRLPSVTSESSLSTISHSAPVDERHFYLSPESARLDGVGAETLEEEHSTLEADGKKSPRTAAAELRMRKAIKNAELQRNHARLQQRSAGLDSDQSVLDGLRSELLTIVEQSKIDARKSSKLQEIINKLDEERNHQVKKLQILQSQLKEVKEEKDALGRQIKLRDSHYTQIQKDMEEKGSKLSHLTQELQRKEMQIVSLESQLEKTTTDFREQLSSLSQVDLKLREKSNQFDILEKKFSEKSKHVEEISEKLVEEQSLHSEQCRELEHHIGQLQDEVVNLKSHLEDENKRNENSQKQITEKTVRVGQLEAKLHQTQMILQQKDSEYDVARQTLERQMKEGWSRSSQLEAALVICKEELAMYITKLKQSREKHQLETATKSHEVLTLENQLQRTIDEMEEKANQTTSLERALDERQQMLLGSNQRITELEERESQLEEQVSYFERELTKLRAQSMEESDSLDTKLNQATVKLDEKTKQLQELLKEHSKVKVELQQLQRKTISLETEVSGHQKTESKQNDQLVAVQCQLQTLEKKLTEEKQKVSELEEALSAKVDEVSEHQTHSRELDVERNRARGELQEASRQLTELQHLLQRSRAEVKEKKQLINELEEDLGQAKDEVQSKENDLQEMESVLKSSHAELEERTKQVNQFDAVVKEHQTTVEIRVKELEAELSDGKEESKRLVEQISNLEQRCFEQVQELQLQSFHKQNVESNLQSKEKEIEDKNKQIRSLEQEVERMNSDLTEEEGNNQKQNQELQMIHEQYQRANQEQIKLRKELTDAHTELEHLSRQLEELSQVCRNKDGECTRLARQLGEAKAREVTIQSQLTSEMSKVTQQQHYELEQKEQELADLQRDHFQLLTLKDQQVAEVNCLKDGDAKLRGQMKYFQEQENKLQAHLKAKDEMLQAANEAVVIKEAECARLSAQISGYERALYSRRANISPLSRISSAHDSPASRNNLTHSSPRVPPPPLYRSMSDSAHQREPYIDSQTELNYPLLYSTRPQMMAAKSGTPNYSQGLEHLETDFKQPLDINERWTGEEKISRPEEEEVNLKDQNGRDSIEGVNMASFQDMLSYVNRKMLQDGRQATQRYKISNTQGTPDRFDFGQMNRDNSSTLNKRSTLADSFVGLGVRGVPEGKPWQEELGHSLSQNGRSNQNHSSDLAGHDVSLNSMQGDLLHPRSDQFGLGNTLPFISSLLANSVESPTLSDKTGGSFPRGVDSPSSLSTRSDQDAKERPTPSQVDANKQASNRPRPPKAPSKDTSKKSVNRSLFDDTKKKGKLSTTKKHRGKIPKR
ncbi:uncharacterized protein [Apostichopus japonicus]|uniref:uncharacterized protein isoform X1 n=1 Tax=Stichopus japonicus TaxID=307972 RepID=UPI003AB20C4D